LTFGSSGIAAVAEKEGDLIIERAKSCPVASRALLRAGRRKREFSPAAVRKAQENTIRAKLPIAQDRPSWKR
jgi:hypothetical protein